MDSAVMGSASAACLSQSKGKALRAFIFVCCVPLEAPVCGMTLPEETGNVCFSQIRIDQRNDSIQAQPGEAVGIIYSSLGRVLLIEAWIIQR